MWNSFFAYLSNWNCKHQLGVGVEHERYRRREQGKRKRLQLLRECCQPLLNRRKSNRHRWALNVSFLLGKATYDRGRACWLQSSNCACCMSCSRPCWRSSMSRVLSVRREMVIGYVPKRRPVVDEHPGPPVALVSCNHSEKCTNRSAYRSAKLEARAVKTLTREQQGHPWAYRVTP